MSVANPARCLLCSFSRTTLSRVPRRQFHISLAQCANRTPKHPNIKASDLKKLQPSQFQPYTNEEKARLSEIYSPEQIAAIEAGESSIDSEDMAKQFAQRDDPWAPNYVDDFSTVEPAIDHHVRAPDPKIDPELRLKTYDEFIGEYARFLSGKMVAESANLERSSMDQIFDRHVDAPNSRWKTREELIQALKATESPEEEFKGTMGKSRNAAGEPYTEDPDLENIRKEIALGSSNRPDISSVEFMRFLDNYCPTVGKNGTEFDSSSLVPDIFQPGETLYTVGENPSAPVVDEEGAKPLNEEPTEALARLMKTTGYNQHDLLGLRVKNLVRHNVVNQTRLGKIRRMYVLSIAGNGKGLLGIGEGKAEEAPEAQIQAQYRAIRNMQPIPMYEGRTIYGDVRGKVGAVELLLMHRPPGFGLRCQQYIWEMCRAAGIKDIAARVTRSRNPMNTVKAAYQALMSQRLPEDIARARGKKLVDVRKVYYAGRV